MAKSELEAVTEDAIKKGGILAKLYFDMQSEKEEDLQPLMADLINNRLLKAPGVIYCYGSIDEPIKTENTYSTNAVLNVLFKDVAALINVAFNFVPAGVEIIKPEGEISLKPAELQALALDVAQISVEYTKYILERTLTKEDYAKVMQELKNREELGRKLLDAGKKQ
ncbi:MAG: hypothetical protein QW774_02240 [Candidatus Micrarchaeaceae archaeon]